jgi:hypothetical protein
MIKKSADPSQWNKNDWAYHNKKVSDWNEIEWENVYELYCAAQLWELDSRIDFDEFKKQMIEDTDFARENKLKPGIESSYYDPCS